MKNQTQEKKILVLIGGSGFIGSALGEHFSRNGWTIHLLTRTIKAYQTSFPCTQFPWDGKSIPTEYLEGTNAVINLAGQGIADKPWTTEYRNLILESRIQSTRALAVAMKNLKSPPPVVVQASAVGFFGMQDRSDPCHEHSEPGRDFLADVSLKWEKEIEIISNHTRLVIARIGLVLGWEGGALPKLWDIYSSGLGSSLGNGKQWMNWIHIADIVRFFFTAVEFQGFSGIYNLVAPGNIDNRTLHTHLSSNTLSLGAMKAPAFCLKAVMGSRANLLLSAPRVISKRLTEDDFKFKFPEISDALADLISERSYPKAHYLKLKQWVPCSLEEVWDFISSAANLERITPHWLNFRIQKISTAQIELGTKISYSLKVHGVPVSWRSHISKWNPKFEFVDEQEKGPYSLWFHRHLFSELAGGTLIEDRVEYRLPFFPIGEVAFPLVKMDLKNIFTYRKHATAKILCSEVASQSIFLTGLSHYN